MTQVNPLIEALRHVPRPRTELDRILELPVRLPPESPPDLTQWFRRPGGELELWDVQNWALLELIRYGGLLAPIGVGCGKTLISLLAPLAYGWHLGYPCERPLLLIPAKLKQKTLREQAEYAQHFRLHPNLQIMTYWSLSREENRFFLEEFRPDFIVADEGHKLKHRNRARSRRIRRWFSVQPETGFVVLSGTITSRSVFDYAHLAAWALKENAPLPLDWSWLKSLSACVDVGSVPQRSDIWRLKKLFDRFSRVEIPQEEEYWDAIPFNQASVHLNDLHLEHRRSGLQERLITCPGVITTRDAEVDCSLIIETREGPKSHAIESALYHLQAYWELPGAEAMFVDGSRVAEAAYQIAQGFYYVWDWPGGEPDYEWLDARSRWSKAVRSILLRNVAGLDSELLVRKACQRGEAPTHEAKEAWRDWSLLRTRTEPPKRTVWVCTSLIDDAAQWLEENDPGIIWYRHSTALPPAFAERGIPCFGSGEEPPSEAISCAMSIGSQAEGKNLQDRWSRSLVLCPPPSGDTWEQILGRTHRIGQPEDEVWYTYYDHLEPFRGAMRKALETARYLEKVQGRQRLLYCTHV